MTIPQAIAQFMGVIFLLAIIWKLLSKAKLLPAVLYLFGANTIYPVWVAEHQLAYYGIMALCLLYPAGYWLLRYRQHRQEEAEAMADLLASARPLYGPSGYYGNAAPVHKTEAETVIEPDIELEPEPGTPEWDDYWYDR